MKKSQTRSSHSDRITPGSLSRALALIGDSWALLILKEAFLGVRRFHDFQSRLGISRQTLMLRLNHFTEHAIFYKSRVQYEKVVYEYRLTPKGADLYTFILMVWRLHRRWRLGGVILPTTLYHRLCGKRLEINMYCGACREPLVAEQVQFTPGPGRAEALMESPRRTRIVNELEELGPNYLATVVLGDGWSVLVLNAVLRGLENFDEIHKALQISSNILSVRLKTLLSLGLLTQEQSDQDKRKFRYQATSKGRDVYPMIMSLIQWGDRWLAGSMGPPDLLTHTACGHILEPAVYCNHCWKVLRLDDVSVTPVTVRPSVQSLPKRKAKSAAR
jgi:DNA-binding HxlR family transcriptional regulator